MSEKQSQINNGDNNNSNNNKEIIKTWLAGSCSCTLVIPKEFAKEYGLDKSSHVVIEQKPGGILTKKIDS